MTYEKLLADLCAQVKCKYKETGKHAEIDRISFCIFFSDKEGKNRSIHFSPARFQKGYNKYKSDRNNNIFCVVALFDMRTFVHAYSDNCRYYKIYEEYEHIDITDIMPTLKGFTK